MLRIVLAALSLSVSAESELAVAVADVAVVADTSCNGDHKCNNDPTHRVCAQLRNESGQPLLWGRGDFWQITGEDAFQLDSKVQANSSSCICMWSTASLIETVGCENVHIDCDATDVAYVKDQYAAGGDDLASAKACLQQKCGVDGVAVQLKSEVSALAAAPAELPPGAHASTKLTKQLILSAPVWLALFGVALAAARRFRASMGKPWQEGQDLEFRNWEVYVVA